MTAWLKLVPTWSYWVLALVLVAGGQQIRVLSAKAVASEAQIKQAKQATEHHDYIRQVAEANAAVIRKQQEERQALADELASLDTTSTRKLTNAQQENERLRRLYGAADDERKRLRIEVVVARNDATVSATTGSGSVGDAASVELSPAAGSAVWDIRGGMKADQAKIDYLQAYIRTITAPGR